MNINRLKPSLIISVVFMLHYSPIMHATENDYQACADRIKIDAADCQGRCDQIPNSTDQVASGNRHRYSVDTSGKNDCYMNCENNKASEIASSCEPLRSVPSTDNPQSPLPPPLPDLPRAPDAGTPALDKLITFPDDNNRAPPATKPESDREYNINIMNPGYDSQP